MKNTIKKSINALLSLALILTLSATIVVPAVGGGVSTMSDLDAITNFYI